MNVRHRRLARLVALTVVVSMPLLGMAGVASAKTSKAGPNCVKHPNRAKCLTRWRGHRRGTGGPPVQITVTVDPNPLVETGQSEIHAVIQVETLPSFAGDAVNIDSSSQLVASCLGGVTFTTFAAPTAYTAPLPRRHPPEPASRSSSTTTATPPWNVAGNDCAPGSTCSRPTS